MSGMSIFKKINEKLDEGWKLTNVNCPVCNTSIVGKTDPKQFYCVKCEMPAKLGEDDDEDIEVIGSGSGNGNEKDYYVPEFDNMLYSKESEAKRKKADELSKKTGELLLQGWAMLEDACFDCLFPLMKSRKGEIVCVGCGPVGQKKGASPQKTIPEETKIERIEKKEEVIREKSPVKQIPERPKVDGAIKETTKEDSDRERSKSPKEEKTKVKKDKEKEKEKEKEKKDKEKKEKVKVDMKEVFEFLQFDESIGFYTKMTQLLSADLDRLSQNGLVYNIEKAKEVLALQREIDGEKMKILKKYKKAHKHK